MERSRRRSLLLVDGKANKYFLNTRLTRWTLVIYFFGVTYEGEIDPSCSPPPHVYCISFVSWCIIQLIFISSPLLPFRLAIWCFSFLRTCISNNSSKNIHVQCESKLIEIVSHYYYYNHHRSHIFISVWDGRLLCVILVVNPSKGI